MKREMCASLEICPTKEEWRSVDRMFGDQCAITIPIQMMTMLFVECLDTTGVRYDLS